MKHNLKFAMLVFVALLTTIGCTNESVNPNAQTPDLSNTDGWRVVWFWDKDKDETSDFGQYTFFFRDGGVFEAVGSSTTVTGTWRSTSDDGSQRLVLFISNTKPLSELNDDWVIVTSGDQSIKLKDDNSTQLEELHFERK